MMNRRNKQIGATCVAAAIAALMSGMVPANVASAAGAKARFVKRAPAPAQIAQSGDAAAVEAARNVMVVQGSGEVSVTPDIARVSVGVYTQNADAGKAAEENATKTDAVIRALKASGVAEKDIRTSDFNIYRREDRPNGGLGGGGGFGGGGGLGGGGGAVSGDGQVSNDKVVITYAVTNNVVATVRKVASAGRVLDAAIKAGANQANGITFAVDNPVPAREKALKLAVANAQSKARALADAAELGAFFLVRIEETGGDYAPTRGGGEGFAARSAVVSTPVQPGEQTVSASVTITYRIVPKLVPPQP